MEGQADTSVGVADTTAEHVTAYATEWLDAQYHNGPPSFQGCDRRMLGSGCLDGMMLFLDEASVSQFTQEQDKMNTHDMLEEISFYEDLAAIGGWTLESQPSNSKEGDVEKES